MKDAQAGFTKLLAGVMTILGAVYVLQVVTPLRLHFDTIIFLSVAESVSQGGGFLYHGRPAVFPPGYPLLVATLIKLHLAHVWVIIGIGMGFLVAGLLVVRSLLYPAFFGQRSTVLGVCIFSMLSFVPIKYSTVPLSDSCFFGVAMCCLAVMHSAASRLTWRKLALSAVLVVVSISIRKIGITLIPVLLWIVVSRPEVQQYIRQLSVRAKAVSIFLVASVVIAFAWLVCTAPTLRRLSLVEAASGAFGGRNLVDSALGLLAYRLKELGEITVNLPAAAAPPVVQHLLPFVGAATFLLVFAGVLSRRKHFGAADVFFISYSAVVLVWPYYDPRFWLPVVPLLIAYSALSLKSLVQLGLPRPLLAACAVGFTLMGVNTLASSTVISFSGSHIGDVYPEYHSTYCAAGYCKEGFDSTPVNADGLHLLRFYH